MKLAKRCLLRNIKGEAKQANRQGDENKSENMSSRQGHRDPQEGLSPSSWLSPAEQIFPSEPPKRKTQKNDRKGGDEGDSCFFLTKLTVINPRSFLTAERPGFRSWAVPARLGGRRRRLCAGSSVSWGQSRDARSPPARRPTP